MRQQHFGIVIRRDGTVPFDPPIHDDQGRHVGGLHPDHKRTIIGHLIEQGHQLEHAPDGSSVRITNWTPPAG